jgi:L-amino acid N-acyltransferase YncA
MVAVVTTAFDSEGKLPAGITSIGIKPALRRQGLGTAVLQQLLARHQSQGIHEHIAFVHIDNIAGRHCLAKVGFVADDETGPNEHGYVRFRQKW